MFAFFLSTPAVSFSFLALRIRTQSRAGSIELKPEYLQQVSDTDPTRIRFHCAGCSYLLFTDRQLLTHLDDGDHRAFTVEKDWIKYTLSLIDKIPFLFSVSSISF
jgi:hypothetical protein